MDFDVKKIAKSAKLKINKDEEATLEKNIKDIINMIERLDKIKLDDIGNDDSLESILLADLPNMKYREDIQEESVSNKELLDNAPKSLAGCIIVPKTVE